MGKKLDSRMMKISKNIEKKQLINNFIDVLRPKVYITNTSNFKKLVQELTGNGGIISSSPQTMSETVSFADITEQESSCTSMDDASVDSFDDLQNQEHLWINQTVDAYRDLESWLLDFDQ